MVYQDMTCAKYPDVCEEFKPDPKVMDTMTKSMKCEMVTKEMIMQLKKAQDKEPMAQNRCMWDYIICYMTSCFGTLSDDDIKKLADKLKESEKNEN